MMSTNTLKAQFLAVLQNLGTLALLLLIFPFTLTVVLVALLRKTLFLPFQPPSAPNKHGKKILLTGGKMTKALQLARSFHAAGHSVFLVETSKYWLSGHRFSNAVKRFYTVPFSTQDPETYCQSLLEIVKKEQIDVFIPVSSPLGSYYESLAKPWLSAHCEVIHFDAAMTQLLDNKYTFCQKAHELGLSAPQVFLITHPQQLLDFDFTADGRRYLLKSIVYDSVTRLDMTQLPFTGMAEYIKNLPISPERPWVMQEFITGQEYCSHSTVRNGVIRLHCCSKSSPFQVNYAQEDNQAIAQWVQTWVQKLKLTGQISFDFIQTQDGVVYPIECNPRTHSAITLFYNHPDVAKAYLEDDATATPITPLTSSKPTYWLYHELWRLTAIRSVSDMKKWFHTVLGGKEAIFQWNDPLPFLMVHYWQITLLLLDNLIKRKGWVRIDFNIGKLVEKNGD